jgi:hypothetical protein
MTEEDTHEKIVRLTMEYIKWQNRFENLGYDESGIKAREALRKLKHAVLKRRAEIQEKRMQRKAARSGPKKPCTKLHREDGKFI